jgi:adiponectin receptor
MATAYCSISPSFRTKEWRTVRASLYVGLGLSAVVPVFHGLMVYGYSHLNRNMGVKWVVLQGALYISGAALYAARIPEKYYPGTFDIYLHSHQIFHFLVVAAAASHLVGLVKAFHSKHNGPYANRKVLESRLKTE